MASPDFDQRAGDRAHHVSQETGAADLVGQDFGLRIADFGFDGGSENLALGGAHVAAGRLKGCKIVHAFQELRRRPHRLHVQRARYVPHEAALERADDITVPDAIAVGFRPRVGARPERGRRFFCGQHAHGVGQPRVERAHHGGGRERALDGERGDLTQSVNARIRPPRAHHRDVASVELAQGVLEEPLNRNAHRLPLPADEIGSVVGECDLEGRHQACTNNGLSRRHEGNEGHEGRC